MACVKLTVVLDSGSRIGPGKAALLEGVKSTGSISVAARAMGMDYKRTGTLRIEPVTHVNEFFEWIPNL